MPRPQEMARSQASYERSWGSLDDLHPSDTKTYLSILDTLRSNGIHEGYQAPQIVMLGASSSGKTAVLRALTHGLCDLCDGSGFDHGGRHVTTRFVTKYVLSRARKEFITVSLCDSLPYWTQPQCGCRDKWLERKTVDGIEQLDAAILSVKRLLEVDGSHNPSPSDADTSVSAHGLCIHIAAPNLTPLTLVDLPSMPENHHPKDPTIARLPHLAPRNSQLVDGIIETYLTAQESTILAVVAANQPLSPQVDSVLSRVRRYDKEGHRTIGVVTKPDRAPPASAAHSNEFMDLVCGSGKREGGEYQLKYPWHVLRTYAPDEQAAASLSVTCEELESRFFQENPDWCKVPEDQRGVASVRGRIRAVGQMDLDRRIVPELYASMQYSRQVCMGVLSVHQTNVGPLGQGSQESRREALLGVARTFKQLAQDGINRGKNPTSTFPSQSVGIEGVSISADTLWESLRLTREAFKKNLEERGHGFVVLGDQGSTVVGHDAGKHHKEEETTILSPPWYDLPEQLTKAELAESCLAELLMDFPRNPCSVLASVLMRRLTKRWESLALRYIEVVADAVQRFVQRTLYQSCIQQNWGGEEQHDTRNARIARKRIANVNPAYEALMDRFGEPFLDSRKDMVCKKLVTLLRQYEEEGPFMDGLGVSRLDTPGQGLGADMIGGLKVKSSKVWRDTFDGILDTVLSQYGILRGYFADAVIGQAELYLVCSLPGIMPEDEMSSLPLKQVDMLAPFNEALQDLESEAQLLSQELLKFPQDLVRDYHLPEAAMQKVDDQNKRKRQQDNEDTQPESNKETPSTPTKTREQTPPHGRSAKRVRIAPRDPATSSDSATSSAPSTSSDSGTSTFDDDTSGPFRLSSYPSQRANDDDTQLGGSSFIRSQAPSLSDGPSLAQALETAAGSGTTAPETGEEPTMPATPQIPRLLTPSKTPPQPLLQHPASLFSTFPTEGLDGTAGSNTATQTHTQIHETPKPPSPSCDELRVYGDGEREYYPDDAEDPIHKQFPYGSGFLTRSLHPSRRNVLQFEYDIFREARKLGARAIGGWGHSRTVVWSDGTEVLMGKEWETTMAAAGAKNAWPNGRPGSDETQKVSGNEKEGVEEAEELDPQTVADLDADTEVGESSAQRRKKRRSFLRNAYGGDLAKELRDYVRE